MDISALVQPPELVERKAASKPFACAMPGCTSSFARRSDLVRHHKIHTGDRQFACTIEGCGKTFLQRTGLTVHIRTHTGEKPHRCETCQRPFADSSSLARHRRIHSEQRLFDCQLCPKSYVRKPSLVHHVQKHDRSQDPDAFDRAMRAALARRPKSTTKFSSGPIRKHEPVLSSHSANIHTDADKMGWHQPQSSNAMLNRLPTIEESLHSGHNVEEPSILPESAFADAELLNGISHATKFGLPGRSIISPNDPDDAHYNMSHVQLRMQSGDAVQNRIPGIFAPGSMGRPPMLHSC